MIEFTPEAVREMLWREMKKRPGKPLSQRELAVQIGVSLPFLNSTLAGAREPQGKILEFLGLERVSRYRRTVDKTND